MDRYAFLEVEDGQPTPTYASPSQPSKELRRSIGDVTQG